MRNVRRCGAHCVPSAERESYFTQNRILNRETISSNLAQRTNLTPVFVVYWGQTGKVRLARHKSTAKQWRIRSIAYGFGARVDKNEIQSRTLPSLAPVAKTGVDVDSNPDPLLPAFTPKRHNLTLKNGHTVAGIRAESNELSEIQCDMDGYFRHPAGLRILKI